MQNRTSTEAQDRRSTVQHSSGAVAEMIELLYSDAVCSTWHPTLSVVDIQRKREAERSSIDLLWCFHSTTGIDFRRIDVKADRQSKTGNFLFELSRDETQGAPGWFLSSLADVFLYFFPKTAFVYALPVQRTRQWVLQHQDELRLKRTKSKEGTVTRCSAGCLVPAERLISEVTGVRFFAKVRRRWLALSYDQ